MASARVHGRHEREDALTEAAPENRPRKWLWLVVRLGVALLALGWTLSRVPLEEVTGGLLEISGGTVLLVFCAFAGVFVAQVTRWWCVLTAYGASGIPHPFSLLRLYLEGFFYNTFLPGNVGGDLLRAHVTRKLFPGWGGGYVIVFVERVFGLVGLLLVSNIVLLFWSVPGIGNLAPLGMAGLVAAFAASILPILARQASNFVPGKPGKFLANLPLPTRPVFLFGAIAASITAWLFVAAAGHALIVTNGDVSLQASMVIVPVAMTAVYFPATVAGLGVREAAFVLLYERVGVDSVAATAGSLGMLGMQLGIAAVGGVMHVLWPLRIARIREMNALD